MRAVQTLLIGMGVGSVAAAADAEQRGPDAWEIAPAIAENGNDAGGVDSGVGVLEPWPDFAPSLAASSAGAGPAYAWVEQPGFAMPVHVEEAGGPATGPSLDAAAEPTTAAVATGGDAEDGSLFDKGTWALQLTGSYYVTVTGHDVTLAYGSVNLGYYYADTWAIDLHVSGYYLEEDGDPEGVAASLGLNLRKHFLIRDPYSVYIDGGVGMIRADGEFPEGGTNTNFTLQAGLGVTYRLNESLHLVGGARWFHISNARRHGEDENESTDGVAVYGGLMWTW